MPDRTYVMLARPSSNPNGPFFHNALTPALNGVVAHCGNMPPPSLDPQIDPRLTPGGNPQRLQLTPQEVAELVAFLRTLTGSDVYTNTKWSDPFLDGQLEVVGGTVHVADLLPEPGFLACSTVTQGTLRLDLPTELLDADLLVYDASGQVVRRVAARPALDLSGTPTGVYILRIEDAIQRIVVQ